MLEFLKDFWQFSVQNKKFWMLPILLCLIVVGFLIIFGQNSALAPLIYALF